MAAGGRVARSAVQAVEYFHSLWESIAYEATGKQRWARLFLGK